MNLINGGENITLLHYIVLHFLTDFTKYVHPNCKLSDMILTVKPYKIKVLKDAHQFHS